MEVKHEGHAGVQRFMVACVIQKTKPDKIDASTWEAMHLKAATYIRCFIDMSLYDNFNEENNAYVL